MAPKNDSPGGPLGSAQEKRLLGEKETEETVHVESGNQEKFLQDPLWPET